MSATTLVVAAAIHAVTAASFLLVGRAVLRHRRGATHGALGALVAWWWGMSAYLFIQAALYLWTAGAGPDIKPFLAAGILTTPLLCGAAGSLTYYMMYLFTGRAGWRVPIAILYAATAVTFYVAMYVPMPTALDVSPWLIQVHARGQPALWQAVYLLVGVPPIASSLALLGMAPRLDRPQRYRAVLVGIAILAYVGGGLAAFLGTNDTVKFLVLTFMGLFASVSVLMAYYPPPAVRRWLGIEADAVTAAAEERRRERRARLAQRCLGLV